MSSFRSLLLPALFAIALTSARESCGTAGSIHPLITEESAIFDPRLTGPWSDSEQVRGDQWVFIRPDSASMGYALAIASPADARTLANASAEEVLTLDSHDQALEVRLRRDPAFRARRVRDSIAVSRISNDSGGPRMFIALLDTIGGEMMLDAVPFNVGGEGRVGPNLIMPLHWFWRIQITGDRIELRALSSSWLSSQLSSGTISLPHEQEDSHFILTAPTADIRRLAARFARDTSAWGSKPDRVLKRVKFK